ncbi:MAG: helix-turn-helix transcriptional regulator [Hungatella hathewayi]|uniref:PadR family transcriptional regulator n=1 Tax=Hungatella TaxID=1649459 RepID=UPI00110685AD|nr:MULTISPECIES: helix-turn-helix transcriptional regulator [Hungatella]MCI7380779.1 PadR family transcriptional regulator [Hungatella sp.]MDY6235773.1 helix-turn-helix transcriptional regulator [Hungatella hathewayi]
MGNKRIEVVSESMFYTLMAFLHGEYSGAEIAGIIDKLTNGRVRLGPATLYTILGRFEEEQILVETRTEGRKRIYRITDKGIKMYHDEHKRLAQCLADAIAWEEGLK